MARNRKAKYSGEGYAPSTIYYRNNPERRMLSNAKDRARIKNLEFNLTLDDIAIPDFCPLLGIPIQRFTDNAKDNVASLDRIDPLKGYVKGNVWVISNRANTIKSRASWQELYQLALNLKAKIERIEDEKGNQNTVLPEQ